MSEIIYVCPQLYLNSDSRWKSDSKKPGYIPILRADVTQFQESLESILSTRNDLKQGRSENIHNSNPDIDSNSLREAVTKSNPDLQVPNQIAIGPIKYQTLQHFLPISLEQQLYTISIMGVPAKMANKDVETFLNRCIRLLLQHLDAAQQRYEDFWLCWTSVQSLETQEIFVRFSDVDANLFAAFVQLLQSLFQYSKDLAAAEVHMDVNTQKLILDQNIKSQEPNDGLVESFNRLWLDLDRSPTDKTHEQESNMEYQVDLSTLSDLPQDSLDQLCQDIINFRTHVLTIEREKRVRESYEENKRRRQHMMKIFDQIRKSRHDTGDNQMEEEVGDYEDEDEDGEDDEDEDEDDWTLEKRQQDLEKQESNRRYNSLLKQLQSEWEPKLVSLQKNLYRAGNYDQVKLEERPLNLKELSHLATDPHYDHNRSYRQQEEQKDENDRREHPWYEPAAADPVKTSVQDKGLLPEAQESSAASPIATVAIQDGDKQTRGKGDNTAEQQQFKVKFAFKKAIDNSTNVQNDEEDEDPAHALPKTAVTDVVTTTTEAPDILPEEGLDVKLEALNHSGLVQELVKEYLGVYEQELVDYIFDKIREERSKAALLTELRETFDEDAVTIVEKIWGSKYLTTS